MKEVLHFFRLSVLTPHSLIKEVLLELSSRPGEFLPPAPFFWASRPGFHIKRAGRTKWFYECFMECLSDSNSLFIQWGGGRGGRRCLWWSLLLLYFYHASYQLEFPVFATFDSYLCLPTLQAYSSLHLFNCHLWHSSGISVHTSPDLNIVHCFCAYSELLSIISTVTACNMLDFFFI